MSEVVLKASGITKRFHEGRIDLTVLQGVDLQVFAGETLAIVGSSGSGKSTLLHLMGGLDAPTSGQVELKGQAMSALSPQQQGELRNRHLGFVYQFHTCCPNSVPWTMSPCRCGSAVTPRRKPRTSLQKCWQLLA